MDFVPVDKFIQAVKAKPAPARPNVPRRISKVLPVTPTSHAKPRNVRTKMGTRPLPGTSAPTPRTRTQNGNDAAAYIAALAKESGSSPDKLGTNHRGPVDILRVGSDCSGIGRPPRFPPTYQGLARQCAASVVYIMVTQHLLSNLSLATQCMRMVGQA